jgi:hypothetical protein
VPNNRVIAQPVHRGAVSVGTSHFCAPAQSRLIGHHIDGIVHKSVLVREGAADEFAKLRFEFHLLVNSSVSVNMSRLFAEFIVRFCD